MRERRTIHQIYHDIITRIIKENTKGEKLLPTRIQLGSNLSFDKYKSHIIQMQKYGLLDKTLNITDKGYSFHVKFSEILLQVDNLQKMMSFKNVQSPTPNRIILTTDSLQYIEKITTILENQTKLAKQWIKIQKEKL